MTTQFKTTEGSFFLQVLRYTKDPRRRCPQKDRKFIDESRGRLKETQTAGNWRKFPLDPASAALASQRLPSKLHLFKGFKFRRENSLSHSLSLKLRLLFPLPPSTPSLTFSLLLSHSLSLFLTLTFYPILSHFLQFSSSLSYFLTLSILLVSFSLSLSFTFSLSLFHSHARISSTDSLTISLFLVLLQYLLHSDHIMS